MKFIPRNGEKEVISVRIPKALLQRVDKLAVDNSLSRNELLMQCIEYALDNLENDSKD